MDEKKGVDWLKELEKELWPPEQKEKGAGTSRVHGRIQIKLHAKRRLKKKEWERVKKAIKKHKLVVELVNTNMFGGVGIAIYEHLAAPGIGRADHVITLTQEHLPGKIGKKASESTGGNCWREAWEVFSELSHGLQNRQWLTQYSLRQPKEASSYDY